MGFGAKLKDKKEQNLAAMIQHIEPHDLVKFGMIPELVGRIPVITTLQDLDEASLVQILTTPKNALVKQYQYLFQLDGVTLEFTDEALTAIAKKAIERKTGARGLRGIMEGILSKLMFELPSKNASKVIITEQVVEGKDEPTVIMSDSTKAS